MDKDGYLSLFHLTSQKPIHTVCRMAGFNDELDIMHYNWSPNSLHLMVYWRPGDRQDLYVACLSRGALAERKVRHRRAALSSCVAVLGIQTYMPDVFCQPACRSATERAC